MTLTVTGTDASTTPQFHMGLVYFFLTDADNNLQ